MKIVTLIARILLGLGFLIFGLNAFLRFIPGSDMIPPGVAGEFSKAMAESHYDRAVAVFEIVAGVLLLINLYVPVALVLLGPVLVNILLFHLLMMPSTIPPGIVFTVLWLIVFLRHRAAFAGIFTAKA
ncbi:MAG TPA: DoxX family membrane protein [Acidobacteriaceae bacterium]